MVYTYAWVIAALLALAARLDPQRRGHALDFLALFSLGLAADLRWFESAWPHALVAMNKVLLLDAGLYGFHVIRQLDGVGFDLRWRLSDWKTGLRELLFYIPIAVTLGLVIGFLHWRLLEEIFFREAKIPAIEPPMHRWDSSSLRSSELRLVYGVLQGCIAVRATSSEI